MACPQSLETVLDERKNLDAIRQIVKAFRNPRLGLCDHHF